MEYYLLIIIKFAIGFSIVMTHMNLAGKTQLSQMTPIDFIGNFAFGGIIGGVIYNEKIPMHQYIIVLLLGVLLVSFLNFISKKFHLFRAFAIGEPIPIIKNGRFLIENIREKKNKIDILRVASQLHSKGISSFKELKYAQIEPDGQITAISKKNDLPSIIIIQDGKIRIDKLEETEKNDSWLSEKLKFFDISDIKDVFIAEFWKDEVTFIMNNGEIKKS
ncbi:DUF421 domain-containing protein [Candidatus Hamiltonella defensa]|uniref:DUF421 domain-containing protein n=1 Tax=Candidatus Williamhamiltonella defendens TaxID=138072 RepID=A0AAC9VEZ9_9ENTR|nr:YetF domain-containing protein [Candidatus Hamiltonella defensa]ASV33245.1 hypothetical protein CJJ18_03175 [Candidatus Hamiltonella defensa]AWK16205.1 hypothetical protein CCS40_03200 [Candidatus Hamiltonella defensa]MBK4361994.1 DUF421 domain-containing protein [Candidatus Hamiltonella defensa]